MKHVRGSADVGWSGKAGWSAMISGALEPELEGALVDDHVMEAWASPASRTGPACRRCISACCGDLAVLDHPNRAADDGHLAAERDARAVSPADRVRQLDRCAR